MRCQECESRSDVAYVAQSLRRLRFPRQSMALPETARFRNLAALSRPQATLEFTNENSLSPLITERDVQLICIDEINGVLQKHLGKIAGLVKWQLHRPSRLCMFRCGRIPGNSLPPGSATLQLRFQFPVCLIVRRLRQKCSGRGPCRHNCKSGRPFPGKTMCIEKCFEVRRMHC